MYNIANSWVNNAWSASQAQRAWNRSVEASQNAHQWEVEDLRKAGLNPILSATGGNGAHVPSPIQAQVNVGKTSSPTDIASVINSSKMLDLTERKTEKELELSEKKVDKELELAEKKTNAEVDLMRDQAYELFTRAGFNTVNTGKTEAETRFRLDENIRLAEKFGYEKEKLAIGNLLSHLDAELKSYDVDYNKRLSFKNRLVRDLKGVTSYSLASALAGLTDEWYSPGATTLLHSAKKRAEENARWHFHDYGVERDAEEQIWHRYGDTYESSIKKSERSNNWHEMSDKEFWFLIDKLRSRKGNPALIEY